MTTAFGYAGNRLTSETDRLGRIRSYQYNGADQLIGEQWSTTANSAVSHAVAYGHDANGNLTSATDALSSGNPNFDVTIAYDALNRPSHTTQPFGVTLDFAYDKADNRTQVIDNKGGQTDSTYDDLNRLKTLTLSGSGVTGTSTAWAYDKTTADLTSVTKAVGGTASGTTAYGYDALGRNDSVTQSNGSGVTVGSYTYTRDLADRLTGSSFTFGSNAPVTHSFSYYDDNQLKVADGVLSKYDDGGNLKGTYNAATGAQLSSSTYGAANRLQNDGVYTYTYDDAGQMTGKSKSGESWTYGYDSNGQMTSASNGTDAVAYTFDAFGNRLSRVQSGGTSKMERFAYDGADAFLDLDGSNAVTTRRQYGPGVDNLLSRQSGGSVEWYGTDAQGSVRQVFDNTGNQTSWADYEAHGALVGGGTLTDRYGFTGREEDGLTGQRYHRARVVDGQSWTSEDPMGFAAGDANLRRYVGNGPTNYSDPSGLFSLRATWDEVKSVGRYIVGNSTSAANDIKSGLKEGAENVADEAIRIAKYANSQPLDAAKNALVGSNDGSKMMINSITGGSIPSVKAAADKAAENYSPTTVTVVNGAGIVAREAGAAAATAGIGGLVFKGVRAAGLWFSELLPASLRCLLQTGATITFTGGKFVLTGLSAAEAVKAGEIAFDILDSDATDEQKIEALTKAGIKGIEAGYSIRDLVDTARRLGRDGFARTFGGCFAAGTLLRTPNGLRSVESMQTGDWVLARPESDPNGQIVPRRILLAMQRLATVLALRIGGQTVRPTVEHPFWTAETGWTKACDLRSGDRVRTADGWAAVESVGSAGEVEAVYNIAVDEDRTYFVGGDGWGFDVWVHNADPTCPLEEHHSAPTTVRPSVNTSLPGRVTGELPPGQMRTPGEVKQARNFFERNREAAERWWSERNGGKPWPKNATHAEHPRPLKDGGDPLCIEPGFNGPNAPHMVPGPDGLTDFQRWGRLGGRPPKQ